MITGMKLCTRILRVISHKNLHSLQCKSIFTVQLPKAQDQQIVEPEKKDVSNIRVNPLRYPDYFGVKKLVTVEDLFESRVHMGHKEGSFDQRMLPFIFGSRLGHLIFDLEKTADFLRQALNITAHVAYRGGIILFISNYHQHCSIIENTALECSEFAQTRNFYIGLFTDSTKKFKAFIRLPDLCIFLNTLNDVMSQHNGVTECAKMNIPTIGIVDSNCNPNLITYPVPGNDDSIVAIEYYCNLFKQAIMKGKEARKKDLQQCL